MLSKHDQADTVIHGVISLKNLKQEIICSQNWMTGCTGWMLCPGRNSVDVEFALFLCDGGF